MVLDTLVNNLSSMYSPLDSHLGYLERGGNGGMLWVQQFI